MSREHLEVIRDLLRMVQRSADGKTLSRCTECHCSDCLVDAPHECAETRLIYRAKRLLGALPPAPSREDRE